MDMRSLLSLSVLLALVREDKGEKPTVSLLPRFPDVFVGDDVTLICKGGGEPIKWFINGKPLSHQDSLMILTAVTSKNNGNYECERAGSKSDPYRLTVEELEPHAQLSPSIGGAVMTKGDGRNLVLQVDDDPTGWKCFVLRGKSAFMLGTTVDKMKKRAVIFAELKEANRSTFWCKNGTQRSNAVTLKMTELRVMLEPPAVPALMGESVALRCAVWGGKAETAIFYKDKLLIANITKDTYIITNATQDHTGQYRCHATYRYSHISAEAALQEGDSDAQELNVIDGPPAPTVYSTSPESLECFCRDCPDDCTSYYWYHTLLNDSFVRRRLPENTDIITIKEGGLFSCRMKCGKGFSRFSKVYKAKPRPESVNVLPIMVAAILMILGVLIVVLIALKRRRRGGGSVQATAQGGKRGSARLMDMRSLLTLSVLLALIREDKGEKPAVSLLPRFPDVFVGDDVTLICKGGGEPIKWFINGIPLSHQDSLMILTAVTSKNNGNYECERAGSKSDPYRLTVEELEPHAQLSPSIGGAVMTKGDGRNLVLQVDDDLTGWKCFVLRGKSAFMLGTTVDKMKKRAVIFAELKEANRSTFWCKNGTQRSNAVTLKMTELRVMLEPPAVPALMGESVALRCAVWGGKAETAIFYKDNKPIANITKDTYIITNATQDHTGQYRCHATYRDSLNSAEAALQEGDSDAQELNVIDGPPATTVYPTSPESLECFCKDCPDDCTSYYWYHTLLNDSLARRRLPENTNSITMKEEGLFSCRIECGKGFSRFSKVYSYEAQSESESVNVLSIMMTVILTVLGVLIVMLIVLMMLKCRKCGGSYQVTDRRTGGDQIQLNSLPHSGREQGQG
ncbi:uncharacterized protein LOC143727017 [Siphateles boraxobius]|uniref:uncharacterized protein LOC143727017 n=1 Tax=Siphateles boraxobius TaxID=180520 RepID=UPI00406475A4